MSTMASQISGVSIVYLIVCSGTNQRNVKAPRHLPLRGEFTGDQFPFDDVIILLHQKAFIDIF